MKRLLLCLWLCILAPAAASAASLETLDDTALNAILQENRGKVVILNFFATWCPPCRVEIPELVKLRGAFPEDKLLILGLSVDEDASKLPPFLLKLGVNYPVYLAGKDITDKYKITSVPHNAFFTPAGQIKYSEPGMAESIVLKRVVNELLKEK